jgi:hypothetical protein
MKPSLFDRIERAPRPDFGDILSKSFKLFADVWVESLVHCLITILVVMPIILIVYIPLFPMYAEILTDGSYSGDFEPTVAWVAGYILVILAASLIINVFVYAIYAHFFAVLKKKDLGTQEDVGGYFSYLKNNFGKLFVLNLASTGIALLAVALCYLPIFYVMVPLQLVVAVFAFNPEMGVSDLIKASFKLGNKYWLTFFGLIILSSIIAQLGILLCFVGIFATAFFAYIPIYYVYKDCIGFDQQEDSFSPQSSE